MHWFSLFQRLVCDDVCLAFLICSKQYLETKRQRQGNVSLNITSVVSEVNLICITISSRSRIRRNINLVIV